MPWLSTAELRRLVRDTARAERRAERAESALEFERQANRASERHWANQFLRKMNSYPMPAERKPADDSPPQPPRQKFDSGELDALIAEAERLGHTRESAIALFAKEKGLSDDDLADYGRR